MSQNPFYITTPLYYVNDKPHLGHAYTTVAADVMTRWHKMHGKETHFLTGTDEHGQKVFDAAKRLNKTPQQHVDAMVEPFKALWEKMDIEFDDFIRTTEERHTTVVKAVLMRLFEKAETSLKTTTKDGTLQQRSAFGPKKIWSTESAQTQGWQLNGFRRKTFFQMSKYVDQLRKWIEENPTFIQPESRRNEMLGYLRKDVGDLCISRPKSRLSWGIELPFDAEYVTYVWFDALLNYVTALGYHPTESEAV